MESEKHDIERRRRERYIIAGLILIISILTTYLGIKVFDLGLDLPISNSVLIFALININVILLLLLLFLTMRNLVKLLYERKKKIMGARLRSKLVMAFITLSLLPTIILFFVSVQFISTSVEYWFNLPIERSLKNSLEVGQEYYNRVTEEILSLGNSLSRQITYHGTMLIARKDQLEKFINEKRRSHTENSIRRLLGEAGQKETNGTGPEVLEAARYILQHFYLQRKGAEPDEFENKFFLQYNSRSAVSRMFSTQLGYILGNKLYYAVKKGKFPVEKVRAYFHDPFDRPRAAFKCYLDTSKRLRKLKPVSRL